MTGESCGAGCALTRPVVLWANACFLLSGMGPGDCAVWWWSEHASCESLWGLAVTYRLLRASMFYRDASEGLLFTFGLGTSESLLVTKRTCILWTLVMGCVSRAQCCALSCFVMMRTAVCVLLLRLRLSDCLFWYSSEHASFESRYGFGAEHKL